MSFGYLPPVSLDPSKLAENLEGTSMAGSARLPTLRNSFSPTANHGGLLLMTTELIVALPQDFKTYN